MGSANMEIEINLLRLELESSELLSFVFVASLCLLDRDTDQILNQLGLANSSILLYKRISQKWQIVVWIKIFHGWRQKQKVKQRLLKSFGFL